MRRNLVDPAMAVGVATGSNRINSSGIAISSQLGRSSRVINNSVPAGGTIPVPASGTTFYLLVATGTLQIRPSSGQFSPFNQGQGLRLLEINAFDLLELKNENSFTVVFSLFVGFDEFIDMTLITANTGVLSVTYPTYPVANSAAVVNIPDISGAEFQDINGTSWYALQRQSVNISNSDSGVTLSLLKANATGSGDPAVIQVFPQTSIAYPSQGDFRITTGGGNINAIVSELYQSIRKTT
jgi:hypothetical protein